MHGIKHTIRMQCNLKLIKIIKLQKNLEKARKRAKKPKEFDYRI